MNYKIFIEKSAQRSLAKIPQPYQDRLVEVIRKLGRNPRPMSVRKLSGRNAWRIRVGNYRVIYEIDDDQLKVLIIVVGHRREVYRIRR
ncbi:MAG: type II toxin-antitoxin system RelE/ParE family toxin [Candidatus Desantisbacteria bacterium]